MLNHEDQPPVETYTRRGAFMGLISYIVLVIIVVFVYI